MLNNVRGMSQYVKYAASSLTSVMFAIACPTS